MRFFGLEITKAAPQTLSSVSDSRGWYPLVRDWYPGAWQRNQELRPETVLAYHAVYACHTLIVSDVGKLWPKLVQQDADGIWTETQSSAFSPVLRKPNHFQNHILFKESWASSILSNGNTYILKQYDDRGVVRRMYPLDPTRVTPLVAPDGSVYYRLNADNLAGLGEDVVVPADGIIHDRINCLFHPLVGTSPLFACGAAANVGIHIQNSSTNVFQNGGMPSGILTAPGKIEQAMAEEMSARWHANYSGKNAGKVAVLGSGLEFKQLSMTSVDAQLVEQLRMTAEMVCSAYHVPPFKIGVGQMPTYSNGEILDNRYYSDCLQSHIEHMEAALDEGLGIGQGNPKDGKTLGVELDLDGLSRMDSATQMDTLVKGVRGGVLTPNGARKKIDEKPLPGGDTIYLQHQDYPMEMVFERTDLNAPAPAPALPPAPETDDKEKSFDIDAALGSLRLGLRRDKAAV